MNLESPWEGMIETTDGQTFVKTVGSGPMVFMVHGGPGFDHGYLFEPLSFLSTNRTLVFYDQPGCGKSPLQAPGVSLAKTAQHFRALMDAVCGGGNCGLIAHSWGSLVALAAFANPADARPEPFSEGMLINPVPQKRQSYDMGTLNLMSRIPPETMKQAEEMMKAGESGESIINTFLPYYCTRRECLEGLSMPFRYDTYFAVNESLGDFDFTSLLPAFANLTLVRGADDFTTPDLLAETFDEVADVKTMNSVGHFPFMEDEKGFVSIAKGVFT